MTQINRPEIVAELTELYRQYEAALCQDDLAALDRFFWDSDQVIRFGTHENLYGIEPIRAFRQNRPRGTAQRQIFNLEVVTFDTEMAVITLEFRRSLTDSIREGRQTQVWRRFPSGWKIVSAHVSLLPD